MATFLDRLLFGGTLLLGGLVTRKVGEVDLRTSVLERGAAAAPAPVGGATTAARAGTLPALPLPTGYGLQVVGPAGEELLLPVCLPPGFELDSLVLRPAFLPADASTGAHAAGGRSAAAPAPSPEAVEPAPVVVERAPAEAPRERLRQAMQLVYGQDATYRTQVDVARATEAPRPVDHGGLRTAPGPVRTPERHDAPAPVGY